MLSLLPDLHLRHTDEGARKGSLAAVFVLPRLRSFGRPALDHEEPFSFSSRPLRTRRLTHLPTMKLSPFQAHQRYLRDKADNSRRLCSLPGCGQPRHGLHGWCRVHAARARLYGHPLASPMRPSTWTKERREVAAVFAGNVDHPGLLQVLRLLADWMARAGADEHAFKGARELARLLRHGVTPLAVATEVAAFWSWQSVHGGALPTDRALDFALARAVFMLAPRERRVCGSRGIAGTWGMKANTPQSYSPKPSAAAMAYVGRFLRQALAPFLANVLLAVGQRRELRRDPSALLRLPFTVTP